jgi:hypothetical protein
MRKLIGILGTIAVLFSLPTFADTPLTLGPVISWNTPEGAKRLQSASLYMADFFKLANQFENQTNLLFCGPTTAAIVLNAFHLYDETVEKPSDERALTKDERYLGETNPIARRFTPNTVLDKLPEAVKTRAQVLGQKMDVGGEEKSDPGLTLEQLHELFKANGLKSQVHHVEAADGDALKKENESIKAAFMTNLRTDNDFVIVNYFRPELGQKGGGHISPLGAYDKNTDSFLILDVNSTRATWVWVKTDTLIAAMRTKDGDAYRGYVLISK